MKLLLFWCAGVALAADGTRAIVPEEFVKARPGKPAAPTAAAPKYRPLGVLTQKPAATALDDRQVGVTIWRLRPSTPVDTGARILVQEDANSVALTPERVSSTGELRAGDRVRLTIESGADGYLYVIDRERYGKNGRGEPQLIFPTTRTRSGDNHVMAGRLIDIPGQEDQPNFFTLRQSRPDHTGEELTVIVTQRPIEGLTIASKALTLAPEQVAAWENDWTSRVEAFELSGTAGKSWTRSEQQAAASQTRRLTQDDPPPQTIYRVSPGPSRPVLIKVELRLHVPEVAR